MSTRQKVQIMTDADGGLHGVEQFRIFSLFQILDATVTYPNPDWRASVLDEFLPLRIPTYPSWRGYKIDQIHEPDPERTTGLAWTRWHRRMSREIQWATTGRADGID
jgi:hypothetical protein